MIVMNGVVNVVLVLTITLHQLHVATHVQLTMSYR